MKTLKNELNREIQETQKQIDRLDQIIETDFVDLLSREDYDAFMKIRKKFKAHLKSLEQKGAE
jgi:ferritin-like metal-binding protein YciE